MSGQHGNVFHIFSVWSVWSVQKPIAQRPGVPLLPTPFGTYRQAKSRPASELADLRLLPSLGIEVLVMEPSLRLTSAEGAKHSYFEGLVRRTAGAAKRTAQPWRAPPVNCVPKHGNEL